MKLKRINIVLAVIIALILTDYIMSSPEYIVGDLEYMTSTFDEGSVQEIHTATITLNTFGYEEIVNVNVLSNYGGVIGNKVTVRIDKGYFTNYRYGMVVE